MEGWQAQGGSTQLRGGVGIRADGAKQVVLAGIGGGALYLMTGLLSGILQARATGRGTVFTFTVNHQPFNPEVPVPYVIAEMIRHLAPGEEVHVNVADDGNVWLAPYASLWLVPREH